MMRRKRSQSRRRWLRRTRRSVGFGFLRNGSCRGLSELKRAKELTPGNPTANDLLARVVVYLGRLDEAEKQARQAGDLDPFANATQNDLARVLWFEGKLDEADAVARKPQSCHRMPLRAIASGLWSQCSEATVRPSCAKRNWNRTRTIAVPKSRLNNMRAEIEQPRTRLWLT